MNFTSPQAFWFLLALPVVVLFYLLKRKRVALRVSSTLLWQRFLAESQASAPFQRLRHNWLLLIQLLLLLVAILALSRPYLAGAPREQRVRIMILDASASMKSTDVPPSRFEKAREEALKWVNTQKDGDEMLILQAAGNTEVKQSFTSDKGAARRAIASAQALDSPTRMEEAFALAQMLIKERDRAEVHLFSDGALPPLSKMPEQAFPITFHPVGLRGDNQGILQMDIRSNPEEVKQRAVFVNVANSSSNQVDSEIQLFFNDRLVETKPLKLSARGSTAVVFLTDQTEEGVFKARLVGQDDLVTDNEAFLYSPVPKTITIGLLQTRPNRFLERALRSVPMTELLLFSAPSPQMASLDLLVVEGDLPANLPTKNLLLINGSMGQSDDNPSPTTLAKPPIVSWRTSHPLLRYVNFDNVYVEESLSMQPPIWAKGLVDAPQSALAWAGERGRQRILWLGLDLLKTDWIQRSSFPIFMMNAVEWLNPATQASQTMVRAGDAFRMPVPDGVVEAKVRKPDGEILLYPLATNVSEFTFAETWRTGVYQCELGSNQVTFCVNLLNAAETDTTPQSDLPYTTFDQATTSQMRPVNLEIWRWILLGGLALLVFEWWFYHRCT